MFVPLAYRQKPWFREVVGLADCCVVGGDGEKQSCDPGLPLDPGLFPLSVIVSVEMCFVDSSFYKRKEKGEGGQFCAVRIKKMKQMYLNGLPVCFSTF